MKSLILFSILFVITQTSLINIDESLNVEWELYKTKFNKKYNNNIEEISRRLIWENNLKEINKHNVDYELGKSSYKMGLNKFTDLTHEEFKSQTSCFMNNTNFKPKYTFKKTFNVGNLPDHVDWRTKGYVTPVKNQNPCGTCWAFSATGGLEGQHFKATGKLISFSEQQLVDCDTYYDHGCYGGGTFINAWYNIEQNGIESETSYPYEYKQDHCRYDKTKVVGTCKGYVHVESGSELALQKAVATIGPISVGLNADYFGRYSGGIFDVPECDAQHRHHAVLVVGYGEENGKKYWIVKNSWGRDWGMDGYILMARDKNNQCGIASSPAYPLV